MRVYAIRNKESQKLWYSGGGRYLFMTKGAAKGAFSNSVGRWCRPKVTFNNQDEFEMVEFELLEVMKGGK